MPIRGFEKSSSFRPAARSMARAGARWAPSVSAVLRGFSLLSVTAAVLRERLLMGVTPDHHPTFHRMISRMLFGYTIREVRRMHRPDGTQIQQGDWKHNSRRRDLSFRPMAQLVKLIEVLSKISLDYATTPTRSP